MRITLQPAVLTWARDRADLSQDELAKRVGTKIEKVQHWEAEGELTWKQAEKVAKASRTPFGYLFLESPPKERLPIPDFRTVGGREFGRPSPDLIDVLHQSPRRQDWFRDYLVGEEEERVDFVGSVEEGENPERVALRIRERIGFHPSESEHTTLADVLNDFCEAIEKTGILVVRAGIVGNRSWLYPCRARWPESRELDCLEHMAIKKSELYTSLWQSCDELRGGMDSSPERPGSRELSAFRH